MKEKQIHDIALRFSILIVAGAVLTVLIMAAMSLYYAKIIPTFAL
jgi:hypothetical protein